MLQPDNHEETLRAVARSMQLDLDELREESREEGVSIEEYLSSLQQIYALRAVHSASITQN